MEDLGTALLDDPSLLFMGGGNPGCIDAAAELFSAQLRKVLDDSARRHELLGVYQQPQGDSVFREEVARYLNKQFSWSLGPENIAIANGSQSAVFVLYNLFAGDMPNGEFRRIYLPLCPEYVGYRDAGLAENFFLSSKPQIEKQSDGFFKYHPDPAAMENAASLGAIAVSRPSNPTGNVISDAELSELDVVARNRGIPLIVDGAYGLPFPGLVYKEATPLWNDNTILLLSLSKLGLPGVRTGIVVASEPIAQAFARTNTVINLSSGTLGPQILRGTLDDDALPRVCRDHLKPFYEERRRIALEVIERGRGNLPVHVHQPEGAFFLWLWCENLPIDSAELYQRLKARGVVVLPGNEFFIGLPEDWPHQRECLRLSYAGDPDTIRQGLDILLDELRQCYAN